MIKNIFIATKLHTGGGIIYISFLLDTLDKDDNLIIFDKRAKNKLRKIKKGKVIYISQGLPGLLKLLFIRFFYITKYKLKNSVDKYEKNNFTEYYMNGFPPFFRYPFYKYDIKILCQYKIIFDKSFDNYFKNKSRLKYLTFYRFLFNAFLKKSDILLVQSRLMKDKILAKYKNRVKVEDFFWKKLNPQNYKNGLNIIRNNNDIFTKNLKNINQVIFIYPAAFLPHKNHINLIKAFELASKNTKKKFKLILTIKKSDLPEALQEKDFIFFIGSLDYIKIEELYKISNFLIFPSFIESLGLPLLEAKLNKLPIISSDIDYVYEVCEPISTFNPHSIKEISQAILKNL